MPRKHNKNCCICGRGFYRRPKEIKEKNIFFCKEHQSDAILKYPELFSKLGLVMGHGWNNGHTKKRGYNCEYIVPRKSKQYHKRICKTCGSTFILTDANARIIGRGSYCSQSCYIKSPNKSDTDIERILEHWFIENNIKYEKQKKIFRSFADFFIAPNIYVYADGDYWHSLPKRIEADNRINKQIIDSGNIVIRLKGSEIYAGKRPQLC